MSELLPEMILAAARRSPDAIAVRCDGRATSYATLLGRAGALAEELRTAGAGPEDRVLVCGARNEHTLAGFLACWLVGAAYVPVEPSTPAARLAQIVADGSPVAALVDAHDLADETAIADLPCVRIELHGSQIRDLADVTATPIHPLNIAHVLYTSGSTGQPKGVLTTFGGITDFVTAVGDWAPGVDAAMRTAGVASFGFDAATYDLFVPWHVGGTVVLVTEHERADPERLCVALADGGVTFGWFTPTLLAMVPPGRVPALTTVLCGGEVVGAALAQAWSADPRRDFFNAYGPTEATVSQTAIRLDPGRVDPLPIGHALPGQTVQVVDDEWRESGFGARGELCLGGTGVARGYLGQPGRTAAVFVPDPQRPGARIYRTGDVVRRHQNDGLVYVGRADDQVKVRGQRVEPGEVEHCLRGAPGVREVVVTTVPTATGVQLVAAVTPATCDAAAARAYVAGRLPEAYVPTRIVPVDILPTNSSGKTDRAAVRRLLGRAQEHSTGAGDALTHAWCDALGIVSSNPDDDFFAMGGHSVSAMRLVATIRRDLQRDVSVDDVFEASTLRGLRRRVDGARPLTAGLPSSSAPRLTPSQERLWFVDQLDPSGTAYNVAFAARVRGPLDADRLTQAVQRLSERHDVLRWRIVEGDGGRPHPVADAPATTLVVRDLDAADPEHLDRVLADLAAHRFDLAAGPLWSATLLRTAPHDHVLVLAFHHAIVDGWSQQPIFAELGALYRGESIAPAGQFADYAAWRVGRDDELGAAHLAWWREHLGGAPDILDLPRDRSRPAVATSVGASVTQPLDAETDALLRRAAGQLSTSPAMVVLGALSATLHRLTGEADHLIAGIAADRPFPELADAVGFFVDIVPYRLTVDPAASFADLIAGSQREVLDAARHQGAALQDIVGAVRPRRDPSRAALVQVAYNVYNFPVPELDLGSALTTDEVAVPVPGSPFDLTVYLAQRHGRFVLDLVYNPDLFDEARVRDTGEALATLLRAGCAAPQMHVAELDGRPRTDGVSDRPPVPVRPVRSARPGERSATEGLVSAAWQEVVGRIPDPNVNFFDAGGDSLAVTRVVHLLSERLGRSVPVVAAFQYPTVRDLSAHLDGQGSGGAVDRAEAIAAARRSRTRRRSRS